MTRNCIHSGIAEELHFREHLLCSKLQVNLLRVWGGLYLRARDGLLCLQCRRPGFDHWVGKIPGKGKGYPLQYSGLENTMDCMVRGVAKSGTRLSDFYFHFSLSMQRGEV